MVNWENKNELKNKLISDLFYNKIFYNYYPTFNSSWELKIIHCSYKLSSPFEKQACCYWQMSRCMTKPTKCRASSEDSDQTGRMASAQSDQSFAVRSMGS